MQNSICLRGGWRRRRHGRRWRNIRRLHPERNLFGDHHPCHHVSNFHHWENKNAQQHCDDAGGSQVPSIAKRKGRADTRKHSLCLRPVHGARRRRGKDTTIGRRAATRTEIRPSRQRLPALMTEHEATPLGHILKPFTLDGERRSQIHCTELYARDCPPVPHKKWHGILRSTGTNYLPEY